MNNEIARIVNDPSWLIHRYDPGYDTFHLRPATRPQRREATFLLDEYLAADDRRLVIERAKVAAAIRRPRAPRHLILHSAFCCSTLLANALDVPGIASTLKEPVVLNDLVGWRRRGAPEARFDAALGDAVDALARPFEAGEAVVVKPSNIVNAIAPQLMATNAATRAILMYAPLATFLTSVAKKGLDGHLWVRGLFAGLVQDGITDFGLDDAGVFACTDLQIAALGWLAQQRVFVRLLAGPAGDRVRTLRCDRLLRDPGETMVHVAAHFALPLDDARARAIGTGPAFRRHSKTGGEFGAAARDAEYRAASDRHAAEIAEVMAWAVDVADAQAIPLDLPSPLSA